MTREEAIERIKWYFEEDDGISAEDITKEAIDMAIEALQTDAVEVVRCKDCNHYIVEGITTQCGWCHEYKHSVNEDDYCSYGERKK